MPWTLPMNKDNIEVKHKRESSSFFYFIQLVCGNHNTSE